VKQTQFGISFRLRDAVFDNNKYLRRRVHINRRGGCLHVRIDRQNARAAYIPILGLATVGFGLFCHVLWGASKADLSHALLVTGPIFSLALIGYAVVLAIVFWGAFGVEEITVDADSLQWTQQALKWRRTRNILIAEITEIKAITPWLARNNAVEVTAAGKHRRIGDLLLPSEANELAHKLCHAVGLLKSAESTVSSSKHRTAEGE
jgi:uncharacterized membrane protein